MRTEKVQKSFEQTALIDKCMIWEASVLRRDYPYYERLRSTQEQLAIGLDMTRKQINDLRMCKTDLKYRTLKRIMDRYGVTLGFLGRILG